MKTKKVIEWLKLIADKEIRYRALVNLQMDRAEDQVRSVEQAIDRGFTWSRTSEGDEYWMNVHGKNIGLFPEDLGLHDIEASMELDKASEFGYVQEREDPRMRDVTIEHSDSGPMRTYTVDLSF